MAIKMSTKRLVRRMAAGATLAATAAVAFSGTAHADRSIWYYNGSGHEDIKYASQDRAAFEAACRRADGVVLSSIVVNHSDTSADFLWRARVECGAKRG
ncbi:MULTISPECIES: hypothetical protein [unclassified Streptomyces]|uniref:hypothetical protein n=1 Tax=unclassified Streptomyces TaxID=2593676 RepID=UPI003822ED41